MKVIPRTKDVYKNKGKIYLFRRPSEAVPIEGFIADGTLNPINFHLHAHWIKRKLLQIDDNDFSYHRNAEEADEWYYRRIIKLFFE